MASHASRLPPPRHKDIFPGGFDEKFGQRSIFGQSWSVSKSGGHFSSRPEQLYYSLIERYDPATPTESILVRSAWYGKQTKAAQHEFLVVQVEDTNVPELVNYLVLDRNAESAQGFLKVAAPASLQTTKAIDAFRISYDGDLQKLLQDCQLVPCTFLETLSFPPHKPLRLYELVTLAGVVSYKYPTYHLFDSSCYLFAGLIWETTRRLCPFATYQDTLARKRGKCRWMRYMPSPAAQDEIYMEIKVKLTLVEEELRARSETHQPTQPDQGSVEQE